MSKMSGMVSTATVVGVLLVASLAAAQNADMVRVRGTIQGVDGQTLDVKGRDGAPIKVKLADDVKVLAVDRKSMADVKQGVFVGITAMPQPDGSQKAVEIHIFPEALRGTGEGHRPWDLMPNSTMTNANIESAVTSSDGQELVLKYKDGEKKFVVPANVEVVMFDPAAVADLKPGEKDLRGCRQEAARRHGARAEHRSRAQRRQSADVSKLRLGGSVARQLLRNCRAP